MQDTFARATHSATRPRARATIGYLVYNSERVHAWIGTDFSEVPVLSHNSPRPPQ